MEKWWASALVSLALVGSCARQAPTETPRDNTVSPEAVVATNAPLARSSGQKGVEPESATGFDTEMASESAVDRQAKLRIATFNVKVFGQAKARKPEVMQALASIVREHHVVAMQEIKDKAGRAPQALLAAVNAGEEAYAILLSPRSGLAPDDASSQERYAFLYRSAVLEPQLYPDVEDAFQREPWIARFRVKQGNFSFVLVNIHTKPDRAIAEVDALADVMVWARAQFPDEDDLIALGDFNAACGYASSAQLDALALRSGSYRWIVPDDADTNVAPKSACAYDRIVTTSATHEDFAGTWAVQEAGIDGSISDHYPVWAEFYTGRDTQRLTALRARDGSEGVIAAMVSNAATFSAITSTAPAPSWLPAGPDTLGHATTSAPATNDAFYEDAFAETRSASSSEPASSDQTSFDDTLECCKICHKGKACGDTCIARDKTCHKGPGCACNG